MKVVGMFAGWEFDNHHATDGKHRLWIANGWRFFRDSDIGIHKPLLQGLSRRERKKIWNELEAEIRSRCLVSMQELTK